ncbi:hypothetical protein OIU84_023548 [Salix udensis]|uniref:Uncharacterized protein n=1 Tax=Salix udensis TaxID=889485 RepID=A0AAD6KRA7_9ROSI|nr:hypothetical protein OIU84_023548 [Salix udensis]
MLGLHNILFIAPPPSPFHHHQTPQVPSAHQIANTNDQCNIADNQESWATLNKYQQKPCFLKTGDLNVAGEDDTGRNIGPARACRDCGNRAKKECQYRRCRTCCKSREYDCTTHMKSTWVSASSRRERLGCSGGGDSSASSGGGCVGSSYQDAGFKLSLPGQVREPAVFRCVRVTAINSGEAEVAYQAKSGERTRDTTSSIAEPSAAYAVTGNHRLLEERRISIMLDSYLATNC